jgi:hypothetical protein
MSRRDHDRTLTYLPLPRGPACPLVRRVGLGVYARIALLHWPRLDRAALGRAGNDPQRIARLVARRTRLPLEVIVAMLTQRRPGGDGQPARARAGRDPEDNVAREE